MKWLYSDDNANGIGETHSTRIEYKISLVHVNVSTVLAVNTYGYTHLKKKNRRHKKQQQLQTV
jgi:hypothetical protein